MPTNQTDEQWPQEPEPYWRDSIHLPEFPRLQEDLSADVVIVRGGLTGITSAYLLACEGVKVALLEADKLVNGTSSHMMGKVTLQHGLIYDEMIRNIGEDRAKLYYEANAKAFDFIKQTISRHQIDCDLSEQDACLYAVSEKANRKLEKEENAYQKLGIDYKKVDHIPFNIEIKNGLVIENQVQFHPLKYLNHLIQAIKEKGGLIFENTAAVNVETGLYPQVLTRDGVKVTGNYVLSCSHFPFYEGIGLFWTRMYADRSYILGVKTKEDFPGGLYISVDKPVRSLRAVPLEGDKMVLISGEGHQTGQGKDTLEHYQALKTFGQEIFDITDMMYRWSTQDLITIDKVPYIGPVSSNQPNVLVATGFRKWGVTNGTAAAFLFRSWILGESSSYYGVFSPSRFYANPGLKNFLVDNSDMILHLIKGKLEISKDKIENLQNDDAAMIRMDGERKGAYKDKEGNMHIVDTTCTHIGCEVKWNSGDRTWDCPCHGSRFSYTGEVIEGPAEKPLQRHDHHMSDNLTSKNSGY